MGTKRHRTANMLPTKRRIEKHGNVRWMLDYGLDPATGKRNRPTYETEQEADDQLDRLKKEEKKLGSWWARLPEAQRRLVAAVCTEIEAAGQSLDGVWSDWKRWKKDNQQTVIEPMPYPKVLDEWQRRKLAAGRSEKYVHDSRVTVLDKFGIGREEQPIHQISSAELEKWIDARCKDPKKKVQDDPLRSWDLSSKRTNTSLFSAVWEVAIAKGWASKNITESLEPIGKISRHVRIHTNDTVLQLMAAVMENEVTYSNVLVVFVLGFFGCMRPDEVLSKKALRNGDPPFTWEQDIDLCHGLITVRPEVAKGRCKN